MKTFKELLIELNASKDAIEWAGDRTIEEIIKDNWNEVMPDHYLAEYKDWLIKKGYIKLTDTNSLNNQP